MLWRPRCVGCGRICGGRRRHSDRAPSTAEPCWNAGLVQVEATGRLRPAGAGARSNAGAPRTPPGVLGRTELADVDGVLGDAVELRGVSAKPTLVGQGVRNVLDQEFLWVWVQRPEPEG